MHLIFDIIVNGDYAIRRAGLFYFFTYRAAHRFAAEKLLVVSPTPSAGRTPLREFFRWQPVKDVHDVKRPNFTPSVDSGLSDP
jgi:hypothetical protein